MEDLSTMLGSAILINKNQNVTANATEFKLYNIYSKLTDKSVGFAYAVTLNEAVAIFAESLSYFEFHDRYPKGVYAKLAVLQKSFVNIY